MNQKNYRIEKGFSFLELLIVVAILAILAAVALPEYMQMLMLSKRMEGYQYSKALETSERAYFIFQNSYTRDPDKLTATGVEADFILKHYQFRMIVSDDIRKGYVSLISGNLDRDPTLDHVTNKVGDPGPGFSNVPPGLGIPINDIQD